MAGLCDLRIYPFQCHRNATHWLRMERPYGFLFLESFKPSMLVSESWILSFFQNTCKCLCQFHHPHLWCTGKTFLQTRAVAHTLLTSCILQMHSLVNVTSCCLWFTTLQGMTQFSSVAQSCPTLCKPVDWPHARPPCPSPPPGVYSNSCPLSRWCHPTISSSVVPFSSHLQSFPASGSFPMSQLVISVVQSIGVSASTSVLPMHIQDWFPLGWTGWISLQFKGLSRVSNTTVQKHHFFGTQLSL